jgi:hypothetical protein
MKTRPSTMVSAPKTFVRTSRWTRRVCPKLPKRAPPETKTALKPSTNSEAPASILPRLASPRSVPVIPVT